ncbi:hypothetical protein H6K86_11900 [Staphylococcus epidermidis]|nr:hypothetical protein [Staphylococcus epidermidis]MBM6209918.1 hypothetical protein [Staphylococcus epidermidis]MBM6212312.1 hypothetical protein [Staphylococcus epidermidis]MBM6219225.1 hypothetical protein [Staphylococcus epidermidis]MBM6223747.1 hypothetical protein [Staphylococcus epidermidis]
MSKTILKRVNVSLAMNEKIKEAAQLSHITHEELINDALDMYLNHREDMESTTKEDIYTERLNELTQVIKKLNYNTGIANENILNRIDTLIAYNESPDYLHD